MQNNQREWQTVAAVLFCPKPKSEQCVPVFTAAETVQLYFWYFEMDSFLNSRGRHWVFQIKIYIDIYIYMKWENEKGNTGLADVYRALYCNFLYILYAMFFLFLFCNF